MTSEGSVAHRKMSTRRSRSTASTVTNRPPRIANKGRPGHPVRSDSSHPCRQAALLPLLRKSCQWACPATERPHEEHVEELKKNPYQRRPLADIKKLGGFKSPAMYRMRIGRQRLEYFIDESEKAIYIIKAFPRSGDSDYR